MQMLYTATEGILEHSLLSVHLSQLSKLQRFPKECRQLDTSFSLCLMFSSLMIDLAELEKDRKVDEVKLPSHLNFEGRGGTGGRIR